MHAQEQNPTIGHYSPNSAYGVHAVEIELRLWDARRTETVEVRGNTLGFDVIESAISNLEEAIRERCASGFEGAPPDGPAQIKLTQPDGDTILVEDEGDSTWISQMCVGARIVSWTPPTLNEIRAINGAPPVADGDRPHDPL